MTRSRQPNDYVELHCHSSFSLLDGAALPEVLAARAANLGLSALALTDHDELGGAVRFAQATGEVGIGGIIGAELTVMVGGQLSMIGNTCPRNMLSSTLRSGGNVMSASRQPM